MMCNNNNNNDYHHHNNNHNNNLQEKKRKIINFKCFHSLATNYGLLRVRDSYDMSVCWRGSLYKQQHSIICTIIQADCEANWTRHTATPLVCRWIHTHHFTLHYLLYCHKVSIKLAILHEPPLYTRILHSILARPGSIWINFVYICVSSRNQHRELSSASYASAVRGQSDPSQRSA